MISNAALKQSLRLREEDLQLNSPNNVLFICQEILNASRHEINFLVKSKKKGRSNKRNTFAPHSPLNENPKHNINGILPPFEDEGRDGAIRDEMMW